MNVYQPLIEKFLYSELPVGPVRQSVRFEALSDELFGTKQRRYGPMPPPERQAAVRDVLREADGGGTLTLVVPWGPSKHRPGDVLDVLEFTAVRQLRCLADGMARMGQGVRFVFRLDDLTDLFLLGADDPGRRKQIDDYSSAFVHLTRQVLGATAEFVFESDKTSYPDFAGAADTFRTVFYNYLRGHTTVVTLAEIGWKGGIADEQRAYYKEAFGKLYPSDDPDYRLATYFAATLARVKVGVTGVEPGTMFVVAAFNHPIPGTPVTTPRVHYRTLPERHTNAHHAPWNARGFLRIGDDGQASPRFVTPADAPNLIPCTTEFAGVKIATPFTVE